VPHLKVVFISVSARLKNDAHNVSESSSQVVRSFCSPGTGGFASVVSSSVDACRARKVLDRRGPRRCAQVTALKAGSASSSADQPQSKRRNFTQTRRPATIFDSECRRVCRSLRRFITLKQFLWIMSKSCCKSRPERTITLQILSGYQTPLSDCD